MIRKTNIFDTEPLNRIPKKSASEVRYLTFNINGAKTLFNYHPWNQLQQSYDAFFSALGADIISLQELKVQQDAVTSLGLLKKYRAFISVPKSKKGYSGVGLFVRIPQPEDPQHVHQSLHVVNAEEGVSGCLQSAENKQKQYCQLENGIGGYLDSADTQFLGLDNAALQNLDSEGRCAVVELANNTVVFSLYCPANSMGTEEGELFRLRYLEVLLRRCRNLRNLGKNVVVMGDMNVTLDLIESAEGINERIKKKLIVNNLKDGGEEFEKANTAECIAYRSSWPQRTLLNTYTVPTFPYANKELTQFLHDTTRIVQGRTLAKYTVWNTLTSARQSNYGSRIDLILASCPDLVANVTRADNLPFLYGSDHCPVFTDVDVSFQKTTPLPAATKLPFEAKRFYKLVKHRDISLMFGAVSAKRPVEDDTSLDDLKKRPVEDDTSLDDLKKLKIQYVSRKKPSGSQQTIKNFFFQDRILTTLASPTPPTPPPTCRLVELKSISAFKAMVYSAPKCHHGEACILRTSLTSANKGKKFWICARTSKGNSGELGEHRCDFFDWAKTKGST